ncbi:hypothetical protein [Paenibacillus sp. FSL H8-0537]|uniref:hypothetical protein n=1 Tax=Paenibacillus sp. FSL H8-0537 TaxID=2921399 RepID=UPI00310157AE
MNKRKTAVTLMSISAFLYGTRYISAAIFGSNIASWNEELFHNMLSYIGPEPLRWSKYALILGIIYLVWAEVEEQLGKKRTKIQHKD